MKQLQKTTLLLVLMLCTVCISVWSQNPDGENTPLLEIPETAIVEQWYANDYNAESYTREINMPVLVATDGNDIYVKGIINQFPDSWIKGTIDGSKVCFPGGAYMGYDEIIDAEFFIYGIVDEEYTDLLADYFVSEGKLVFNQDLTLHTPDYGHMALIRDVVLTRDMQPLTGAPVNSMPYIAEFSSPQTFLQFATISADSELDTWQWDREGARLNYSFCFSGAYSDDYLVSPAVYLEAGSPYIVSANAFAKDSWKGTDPVQFEIMIGKEPTAESLTTTILASAPVAEESTDYASDFTVAESGYYHFALHSALSLNEKQLYVSQLSIDYGTSPLSPDAVTDLSIIPGEMGAKNATLTFTTPVATIDGTPLSDTDLDVCIYHDAELWATLQARPGTQMTVFDDGFTDSRIYKVGVVCNLSGLHGKKNIQNIYIGYDVPAAPLNFTIKEQGDHISLKWDKVGDVGANGGYVDPSQVSYEIWYGYVKMFYFKDVLVADNLLDADTYEFAFDCDSGEQSGIAFFLVPKNEAGEGEDAKFIGCVGSPYPTPFDEDFSSVGHAYTWYTHNPVSGAASFGIKKNTEDGNKFMVVSAEEYAQGATSVSPRITVAGTTHAVLSTDMTSDVEGATVAIYIETPDEYELVGEYTLTGDWVTYECDLSKYATASYIRLHYVCDIPTSGGVYIDNIYVVDQQVVGISESAISPAAISSDHYNLNGVRISKQHKGNIHIVNGKKFVVKE